MPSLLPVLSPFQTNAYQKYAFLQIPVPLVHRLCFYYMHIGSKCKDANKNHKAIASANIN